MIRIITVASEENAIKKGKELMNSTNENQVTGKAATEDLNYYFRIWLKKTKDTPVR